MINRVENAAFLNTASFLDYTSLNKQNLSTIVKACKVEVKKDFYETITPKAPLDVTAKLVHIGNTTFTTVCEMSCGGKMKPSVRIKNMHTLINTIRNEAEEIPDWWRHRFTSDDIEDAKQTLSVLPQQMPESAFLHPFAVPLSDTDISQRTRCSSYVRYFLEVASIASSREHFHNIKKNFHEFHIKSMHMLYFDSTFWGDALTSCCWEDKNPLRLHCNVHKAGRAMWYARMDLYSEVFGLH